MKINAQIVKSITLFLFVVFLASCCKDKENSNNCNCKDTKNNVCVIYQQTSCNDPWGNDNESDEAQMNKLKSFFEEKGIKLYNLGMDNKGEETMCLACSCTTGKRFCAKVNKKDLDAIKEYGFKEN